MRFRRIAALLTAAALGAGIMAAAPEAALAVNPPQQWRSPKGATDPTAFPKDSTVLTPAFASNMLSTNGSWFTFLQLDNSDIGTGKIWQHQTGTSISSYISKANGRTIPFDGGNPLGVRSESSNSGKHAITWVDTGTQSTETGIIPCGTQGWCFPEFAANTTSDMSQGVDDTGRFLLWGQDFEKYNDNGTPANPADDYLVGGTLRRMDTTLACGLPNDIFNCKRSVQIAGTNFPAGQTIGGVTSAGFASTGAGNVYYSQFDSTSPTNQTQKLRFQPTVVVNGVGTDVALPAPFDGTPYPRHLSIQVLDVSSNGNYLLFGVVDESGVIDGGTPHYYVRKNSAPVEYREPPLAPAGQPSFLPFSVDNNGNVGVTQTATDATPIEPKIVKWDGNIWPVGPAEDRSSKGGVQYATLSGDGTVVAYPTSLPVAAGDTNGLDDFASVVMSTVPAPPSGTLPTANGGPNKTVAEGSSVTIDASASSSNDAGQPILKYNFDLDNNGSVEKSSTSTVYSFPVGNGPAVRTVGVSVTDPDGTSPVTPVTVTVNNVAPVVSQANVNPRTGTVGVTAFTYTTQSVTDAGGDTVSVAWDVNNDGTVDMTGPNPAPYLFTNPGTFIGNVKATDSDGAVATVSLPTVTVSGQVGNLPTANGGPDQTVNEGATVTINASASSANDAGQSIGTYIFDKGRDGTVDQQSASPVYTFPAPNGPASVTVGVKVVDPDGTSPEDVVDVTVNNAPPVITGAGVNPSTGTAGVTGFQYSVASVTDPGGDPFTLTWDYDNDGTVDFTGANPPPFTFAAAGTYAGVVRATDSQSAVAVAALPSVTVSPSTPVGNPPTADAGADQSVDEGSTVTVDASASSANDAGQSISEYRFDLGNDGSIEQQGASATFTFPAGDGPSSKVVAVTVVDPDATSAPDAATITVDNVAPQVTGVNITPGAGTAGSTAFAYAATVTDPGGDPTTVQWDFDGDGTFDFTGASPAPHVFPTAGNYTGSIKATDDESAATTVALPTVVVSNGTPVTNPPTANAGADQSVDEGSTVTVDASASSANDAGQSISEYRFDLGNDGSIEQQGPSATFTFPAGNGPSSKAVAVTVVDPDGTSAPDTATISVNNVAPVIGDAAVSPTNGTVGTTVFGYSASGVTDAGSDPVTVTWDFDGDGTTDATGLLATHTFATIGTFNGTAKATDSDGAVTTEALSAVTVIGHPATADAGADQTVDEGSTVTIDASASSANDVGQTISEYRFDVGDDGSIEQQGASATFTFPAGDGPATKVVAVTVVDPEGPSASDTAQVAVRNLAPVIADATVSPASGLVVDQQFDYTATGVTDPGGDTVTLAWDFDGNTTTDATGATASNHFSAIGTYDGTLTATDKDGAATAFPLATVTVIGHPPTANAGADQSVDEGSTVTVDASASSANDAGQSVGEYRFDLGNDGSIEQQGPSATFAFPAGDGPASKVVAVTVVDPDATSAPDTVTVTVNNVAPVIGDATVSPTSGIATDTVFGYSASGVSDVGGDPVTVTWDFDGNGTTDATGLLATKTFGIGTYNGVAKATDKDGAVTTKALPTVTVTGHPPTADAGADKNAVEGAAVTIDASASSSNDTGQSIQTYAFDRGNDGTVEQTGPSATYSFTAPDGPSSVDVSVAVTDADGTSAADVATVTVANAAPVVTGAGVSPSFGTEGVTPFNYSVASVTDPGGDPTTVTWDFGDGTTGTGTNPGAHVYAAAGSYQANVTATDDDGAATTVTLPTVTVTVVGGGDPNADDDGDGIKNKFDGQPTNPQKLTLNTLCGSGTYTGATTGTGSVGGCLTTNSFFKILLGSMRAADGTFRMDGIWFFASGKVRTAPNVAYYSGRSLYGFSWTKGFLWVDYQIAIFDNGPGGDRVVIEGHGAAGDYEVDRTLTTGDFNVG